MHRLREVTEDFPKETVMRLTSGKANNEVEGCLFTEQSQRVIPCRGIGYLKVEYLAKGRMAPLRNWTKAHGGEADGSRPCKNVGLYFRALGSLLRYVKQGGEMLTFAV